MILRRDRQERIRLLPSSRTPHENRRLSVSGRGRSDRRDVAARGAVAVAPARLRPQDGRRPNRPQRPRAARPGRPARPVRCLGNDSGPHRRTRCRCRRHRRTAAVGVDLRQRRRRHTGRRAVPALGRRAGEAAHGRQQQGQPGRALPAPWHHAEHVASIPEEDHPDAARGGDDLRGLRRPPSARSFSTAAGRTPMPSPGTTATRSAAGTATRWSSRRPTSSTTRPGPPGSTCAAAR